MAELSWRNGLAPSFLTTSYFRETQLSVVHRNIEISTYRNIRKKLYWISNWQNTISIISLLVSHNIYFLLDPPYPLSLNISKDFSAHPFIYCFKYNNPYSTLWQCVCWPQFLYYRLLRCSHFSSLQLYWI